MNKKEIIKIFLITCAVISALISIITTIEGGPGSLILLFICFILSLPLVYLYKYNDVKKLKLNRGLTPIIVIIAMCFVCFMTYAFLIDRTTISAHSIDNVGIREGINATDNVSLTLSYFVDEAESFAEQYSNTITSLYIILCFVLFFISFEDLTKKTNKVNYFLTIIASLLIVIVNITLLFNNSFDKVKFQDYNYITQYYIYFTLLLGAIITHKFINKEKQS